MSVVADSKAVFHTQCLHTFVINLRAKWLIYSSHNRKLKIFSRGQACYERQGKVSESCITFYIISGN